MKLSIVMPAYNEAQTIEEAVRRVRTVRLPKEIIIVDDASTDGTREILKRLASDANTVPDPLNEVRLVFQTHNQGKGAAIKAGVACVTGDIVIIQDADLEYDPQDYAKLLDPILAGVADVT
ncbi:MAG: glycosyltransferase family 2 protein, partial [Candidatus Binatia bacterium]